MRRLVYVVAIALLVAAGLALAYLPAKVSDEAVLRATAERIATLTGNRVEVRGGASVSYFPLPRFELRDVVLAPRFGEDVEEVASIDVVRGSVAVLPLLIGHVVVKDFVLTRPRLALEVDRRGRENWLSGRRAATFDDAELPPIEDVRLGSLRIEDGALTYRNARSGTEQTVTAINASISWPRLAAALDASGSFIWNGENVQFGLGADAPLRFMNRGASPARLRLDSGVANVAFNGNAHYTPDFQLEGTVRLAAPSARGLLRWIGADPGTGPGLNAVALSGKLNLVGKSLSLSELKLALDGNEAEGGLKLTLGNRTGVQGTIAFEKLDLGLYRARADASAAPAPAAVMSTAIDLSPLDRIVADLRVSAASVSYGDLTLGRSAGTITVRKGAIDLGIGEAMVYGGVAQGTISAAPTPEGAQIKIAMKLDRTDIGPLLAALSGPSRLSGTGTARLDLAGTGTTVAEVVADLAGDATLSIAPGAIGGFAIEEVLTALETGRVEGWPSEASAKTVLDTVTARFAVFEGTATTEDFHVKGPKIEVTAEGEIRLVSASIAGHGTADLGSASGAAAGTVGVVYSVPFVIEGPLANPILYPDPMWLLDSPSSTPEEVEQLRRDLQQSRPEEVIEDLVQRSRDMPPKPEPQTVQPTAPQQ